MEYNVSKADTSRWMLPESEVIEFGRLGLFLTQSDFEGTRDGRWIRSISSQVIQVYLQNTDLNKTIHRLIYKILIMEVSRG